MSGADPSIDALIEIFNIEKKAKLEKFCRDITISRHAMAEFIYAGMIGLLAPYAHFRAHREIVHRDLVPTESEHKAVGEIKIDEPTSGDAIKFFRKIEQTFKQRILLNGHMFVAPGFWHFFHFSQRDTSADESHWKYGSHIHLMNFLTHPRLTPDAVLDNFYSDKPNFGGHLHIRYERDARANATPTPAPDTP